MNRPNYGDAIKNRGFTLVELITVLAIVVITTTIVLPNTSNLIHDRKSKFRASELKEALTYSRNSAISMTQTIVFCPITEDGKCGADWNQQLTVFVDENNDKTFNTGESTLKVISPSSPSEHREYNNARISFGPRGRSNVNAGSLSYCNATGTQFRGISLIISRMGRVREGKDQNRDGVPELANGVNIPCNNRSAS